MNIRNLPKLLLALTFSSLCLSDFPLARADESAIRFYDVEIVIYKNDRVPKGKEYILPVSSPRMEGEILDLSSAASIEAATARSYQVLPNEELRLLDSVASIIDSPRYSLLVHTAWRQPGLELEQTLPVWVKGGRIFGNEYTSIDNRIKITGLNPPDESAEPVTDSNITAEREASVLEPEVRAPVSPGDLYELEGKITVSLSRYLHTYTDLVLRRPRQVQDPVLENSAEGLTSFEDAPDTRILNNHNLKERRRMRSNTLHYLDNPEFSMLVLISPYETAAPETTVETGTGLNPVKKTNSTQPVSN